MVTIGVGVRVDVGGVAVDELPLAPPGERDVRTDLFDLHAARSLGGLLSGDLSNDLAVDLSAVLGAVALLELAKLAPIAALAVEVAPPAPHMWKTVRMSPVSTPANVIRMTSTMRSQERWEILRPRAMVRPPPFEHPRSA